MAVASRNISSPGQRPDLLYSNLTKEVRPLLKYKCVAQSQQIVTPLVMPFSFLTCWCCIWHLYLIEHHDDFGAIEIPISKSVQMFAFCAAMNSCNLGYDVGVSTHAGQLVQKEWDLSDFQLEFFIGFLNLFSIFGALFSQYFSDTYGRRYTFVVAAVGFIIGLLIKSMAQSYAMLMVGRALVGLGVGVGLAVSF
jgi:hypothetical protein